jgi:hypothetical protein
MPTGWSFTEEFVLEKVRGGRNIPYGQSRKSRYKEGNSLLGDERKAPALFLTLGGGSPFDTIEFGPSKSEARISKSGTSDS